MTIVKVVEGSEIYNFPIHHLVHFYSKFWSFTCSNSGTVKRIRASQRRVVLRAAPPRCPSRCAFSRPRADWGRAPSQDPRAPKRLEVSVTCASLPFALYACAERTVGLFSTPSPWRTPTEAAAVLRQHLRRHPVVTGEHAPYLRPSTPLARAPRHRRSCRFTVPAMAAA
jgi:hypothetical protein